MYDIEIRELVEQPVAVIRARVAEEQLGAWFAGAYGMLATHLQDTRVATVGLPFARCAEDATGYDAEAGLPIAQPIRPDGDIEPASLPGGLAAVSWHQGAYATAAPAYAAIADWLDREGLQAAGTPWEVYHSDVSTDLDETTWTTEIIQPYRPHVDGAAG